MKQPTDQETEISKKEAEYESIRKDIIEKKLKIE